MARQSHREWLAYGDSAFTSTSYYTRDAAHTQNVRTPHRVTTFRKSCPIGITKCVTVSTVSLFIGQVEQHQVLTGLATELQSFCDLDIG